MPRHVLLSKCARACSLAAAAALASACSVRTNSKTTYDETRERVSAPPPPTEVAPPPPTEPAPPELHDAPPAPAVVIETTPAPAPASPAPVVHDRGVRGKPDKGKHHHPDRDDAIDEAKSHKGAEPAAKPKHDDDDASDEHKKNKHDKSDHDKGKHAREGERGKGPHGAPVDEAGDKGKEGHERDEHDRAKHGNGDAPRAGKDKDKDKDKDKGHSPRSHGDDDKHADEHAKGGKGHDNAHE